MRRMSIVVSSGLILFIAACNAPPESQPPTATASATLFEGARLITGDEVPPVEDSAFLVQDGKFTSVGRRGEVHAPQGTARVDLTGKTVLHLRVHRQGDDPDRNREGEPDRRDQDQRRQDRRRHDYIRRERHLHGDAGRLHLHLQDDVGGSDRVDAQRDGHRDGEGDSQAGEVVRHG